MPEINIKRIYEPVEKTDGYRVLVDRLWPRGVSKESAHIELWMKEVAPSAELRKWFNHDPEKWKEFHRKYTIELTASAVVKELIGIVQTQKRITLLYSAHDETHNQAVVLQQFIEARL